MGTISNVAALVVVIYLATVNGQMYIPQAIKSHYGDSFSNGGGGSYASSYSMGGVKDTGGIKSVPVGGSYRSSYVSSKTSYGRGSGGSSQYINSGGYGGGGGSYSSSQYIDSGGHGMQGGYMSSTLGCNPPCQNGGKCVSLLCLCPNDYTGLQCQYRKDLCSFKKLKFNGAYKCSDNGEAVTCTVSCPEGSSFDYTPSSLYTCRYATGQYSPSSAPQCILHDKNARWVEGWESSSTSISGTLVSGIKDSRIIRINGTKTSVGSSSSSYKGKKTAAIRVMPKPGVCFTWGGVHYKTFDGKVFSFASKCSHVLVRDGVDNTFGIMVQNSKECVSNPENCYRIIKIFLQDKQYFLKQSDSGIPVFASAEKVLTIPLILPGLRVTRLANNIVLDLDSIGAKLKWDGEQLVQVEVTESLWNKTEGLCGRIDGDINNDILTKNKRKPKNIFTLATSWKTDDFGEVCSDIPTDKSACEKNKVVQLKALTFCKKLLANKKFTSCHNTMQTSLLLDACKWDYCACTKKDPSECACETMNVYVKECAHKGITSLKNWRDSETCPITCTGGRIYKSCGPLQGQPACGSLTELPAVLEESICVEGCFCPDGTVLHENHCITRASCPCKLRGKDFASGQTVEKDCNTCTCKEGQWICTELSCGARCAVIGDPHYTTFDGKKYDFMGQCSYYLVKSGNFSVETENVACAGSVSSNLGYVNTVTTGSPSCTKSIIIKIDGQLVILKLHNMITVNGLDIQKLPYKVAGIAIKYVTSTYVQVSLPNGIYVWWDGAARAYVDIPANFDEKTKGLCGTYNNNQKDDFLTPENDIEQAVIPFANKWKSSDKCNDLPNILITHPCDANFQKRSSAESVCGTLKSQLFTECHWRVDPEQFYQDCLYDMCSCADIKISRCLCPILAAYAEECSRQGLQIDWRSEIKECGLQCTGGQKYQVCANSCARSCADISDSVHCKQNCVEGCNCPEGEALDENGECIPVGQCACRFNDIDFPSGYKEIRLINGESQLCTCVNAIWSCNLPTLQEMGKYSEPTELNSRCNASDNFEYTTCKLLHEPTCTNMHSVEKIFSSACHPGCQCKNGYILDTLKKKCVKPTECPCHHGGRSYGENEKFHVDCNTCVCTNGKWRCSEKECPGECTAWGDSHFKTFDGKHYDYQGQCDYVLAKGSTTAGSFDISIQNVPCGSLGTSCSKSVSIRVGFGAEQESITLTRGKPIPEHAALTHLTIRKKGLFVIIEAPDLGLVVLWDKGTRVYVKLDNRWKNKVKGLCGNYNDNLSDDFQTPSGGITEASAKIFGDSWKLQSYCPETIEIDNTCDGRPDRKIWALKKCGLLKSPLFAPCHSEVPIDEYFKKCVFDTCACDGGGDCECLCTALAAYAQECNNKGIPIKWRTQELCPIQCDERCSTYNPCVSTCPIETCDNLITQNKLSKSCDEDTCVEGCEIQSCQPGYVYYNSSHLNCVPRKSCKTICMEIKDVTYYEGDIIEEDECHSCFCSRGEKICKGQPCTQVFTEDKPLPKNDKVQALFKCKSGWSKWVNQNKIGNTHTKTKTKTTAAESDTEPIPSSLVLSNLEDSSRCEKNQIKDIQCRTVKTRLNWNATGLDVKCDTQDGLLCKPTKNKPCLDFEIRVLCECEKSTAETPLEDIAMATEPKKCAPGLVLDDCALQCDQMCDFYSYKVKESGFCQNGVNCESECVPVNRKSSCPSGSVWANNETCVAIQDCMCRSNDGKPVKPGTVYQESDCEFCQCVDNFYSCDKSACEVHYLTGKTVINQTTTIEDEIVREEESLSELLPVLEEQVIKKTEIFIPNTVTPPNKCKQDNYINLIQGESTLPNSAFNASSTLNKHFSPWFAKLDGQVSAKSGGSWAPATSTPDQYLEINLGRLEPIYGVIVRGSSLYDEYVTSFKVLYSPDGHKYCYVIDEDQKPYIFRGSVDANTPVKQIFPIPIEAKVVKINPQTWHNEISLRVELIGCDDSDTFISEIKSPKPKPKTSTNETATESVSSTTSKVTTVTTTTTTTEYIKNPMGISDGMMSDEQIVVSSELDTKYDKSKLKIDGQSVWQPLTNSPTEFVQFDFLDKRYVTGLVTKGGPDGWVTSYTVEYSPNGRDWNPIVDENLNAHVFLGNFDSTTSQKNYFVRPIKARYIKIVPVKWHKNIQMQIELLGQYKPYPVSASETKTVTTITNCKYCPGVPAKEEEECLCSPEYWFDGEKCVSRVQCPCFVRNAPYEVGSIFENENCAQCICKLGGVSHCKPKKCNKCEEGLKSTITSTCECSCQPCPEGTVLCPTSNVCIDSESWCDGIIDCPDDEINCVKTVEPIELIPGYTKEKIVVTEEVIKLETCPVLECPPGFKKEEKNRSPSDKFSSYLSPMFQSYGSAKNAAKGGYAGIKSSVKGGVKKPLLRRPSNNSLDVKATEKCPEFLCLSNKSPPKLVHGKKECPPATCPPDYVLVFDDDDVKSKSKDCPRYICNPPPPPEAVCNITGNTINTFDDVEIEYEICNHVIARDLISDEWDITLKKICEKLCTKNLIIRHNNNEIVLKSDLSVEYDGYKYTVDQTKKIGSQTQAFSISRLGTTLLFTSNRYGFWIIWDKQGNVKLGIVRKLIKQVDGLCGYFNENPTDDKRKPDGTLARTSTIFGESWGLPDQSSCKEKACPIEIENKAYQICNKVKDESFETCGKVLNVQAFISHCVETTCVCLREADGYTTKEEDCKCQALQSFAIDCLSANPDIDLSQWRMQHDCSATCDAPLVYHDCYQRKCEPTCETVGNPNACPKLSNICFPGCYCPPGLVRKGDTCIQSSSCRDCECNVLPHLKYITYDENNFAIDGNCTYIMSRDIVATKKGERKFQVLVTNEPCKDKKDKMCIAKVTILFKSHTLEVYNNFLKNELKLLVDGKNINEFETLSKWIGIKKTTTKHLKFQLKGSQVEISVYYPSLGVSIKVPSHKYASKLEGLCGDCNKEPENDIPTKYPTLEENVDKLALDWLADSPSDKSSCKNQPIKECKELPPESDPCLQLLDTNKFGQCLRILDPDLFLEWCKKDTCTGQPELSCTAIEAYARDCASAGFCVNWRTEICPAKTCPPGLIYNACGPNCPKTCQHLKEKPKGCINVPVEGCFCPEGKVILNNTCVTPNDCQVCDEEGHHPGDKWKKDKCTSCTCEGSTVKCETQQCAGMNTICEKGFSAVKVPASKDECCDKYTCVSSKIVNSSCKPPQEITCGPGQTMKLSAKSDGCQQYVCECKPKEDCEPLDQTKQKLDEGYVKEIDNSGCCPVINYMCKKELCPKPPNCPQYYNLDKQTIPGKCCEIYNCQAPKDKCIYEAQYTPAKQGGERLRTKYEKQQLVKNLNETWNDGPCRECKCIKSSSSGDLIAACTQTECNTIESSTDFAEYVLESHLVFEQCCATIKRKSCKHLGSTYKVGEKWTKDDDFCTSFECKDTPNGIQKEVLVTNCDSNCDLGYEYEPAPKDSKKCCGTCKPTACVVNGVLHKVDEQWKSADLCTNYFCVYVNGTAQIQAFLVNCPEAPEDYSENYIFDIIPVEGECCKKFVPTACKIGGQIYQEGEISPSPDGDKCKQITCSKNGKGELVKQTNIETCKSECPKGFEYKPYVDKCCGECVAVACVIGDDYKLPGDQWTSEDSCTSFTCEKIGEQLTVSAKQESCPSVDDCPEDKIYVKGCCKYCNLTSESQILGTCSPVAVDLPKTVGLVKVNHTSHGHCVNKRAVDGFTECVGSCHSATSYNPIIGTHESICECCKGIKLKPTEIELECEDGFILKKKLSLPVSCKCQGCTGGIKTG